MEDSWQMVDSKGKMHMYKTPAIKLGKKLNGLICIRKSWPLLRLLRGGQDIQDTFSSLRLISQKAATISSPKLPLGWSLQDIFARN